jgi:PAS domain-containing protein
MPTTTSAAGWQWPRWCASRAGSLVFVISHPERRGAGRADSEIALDGIITMDHMGRIVAFNPAAERLFGYRSPEVIGRMLADVIIPPALRSVHCDVRRKGSIRRRDHGSEYATC